MSTNAIIHIKDKGKTLVSIYKHWDGYVDGGVGDDILKFIKPFTILNGLPLTANMGEVANGMGCFAAQLIKELKTCAGDVSIIPAGSINMGEEYRYSIYQEGQKLVCTHHQV